MIGKIRKGLKRKEDDDVKSDKTEGEEPETASQKKSAAKNGRKVKRAVQKPARRSILGSILEESFARVREDIESIREMQREQGEEIKKLAETMSKLNKQQSSILDSNEIEDLSEELEQVKERLQELQESHEMKFNTHLKELLDQIEGVRKDIDRQTTVSLSQDDVEEAFRKLAEKDLIVKEEVENKLASVGDEIEKLSVRIQEKEESIRQDLKNLEEATTRSENSNAVNKLFEDLNELDNEIIDLKRELNKERKIRLDVRKDLDELHSAMEELQEMKSSILENTNQILDLQRIIGSDFKTKYY